MGNVLEQLRDPSAQKDAEGSAERRQHETFCDKLADQARPPAARMSSFAIYMSAPDFGNDTAR